MKQTFPIYTEKTECQDCYKCVRRCPVKAIKVENGHATVMAELCVACGRCVEVCPAKAKRVRNDVNRAKNLIELKKGNVYVSLAPSWISEFKDVTAERMIAALKLLGFKGVSETALGAQIVSAATAKILAEKKEGIAISSSCPVAVDYIKKYLPEYTKYMTGFLSPALAHCVFLRKIFGESIGIVFVGPCIAKKCEADRHPEMLNIAVGFTELHQWFEETGALEKAQAGPADHFVPEAAEEGSIYPLEGGMIETFKVYEGLSHMNYNSISGLRNMEETLGGTNPEELKVPFFIEALACQGGCVRGPCTAHGSPRLLERMSVLKNTKEPVAPVAKRNYSEIGIDEELLPENIEETEPTDEEVVKALHVVGKFQPEDELNCGGCGYESCRTFVKAMIQGRAEPAMCVSYLRKQAQKKANALLRSMPSGVVIVDSDLKIIECNAPFASMFDDVTKCAYEAQPGLAGASLKKIVPFWDLFQMVLSAGAEIHRDSFAVDKTLFNITIFTIEAFKVVGAVISDVTQSELKREQIAQKAREVITRNLSTVQDIAFKLGEHMADTEMILRSIAEDYAGPHQNGVDLSKVIIKKEED